MSAADITSLREWRDRHQRLADAEYARAKREKEAGDPGWLISTRRLRYFLGEVEYAETQLRATGAAA